VPCADHNAIDASPDQLELPRPTGPYAIGTQRRKVVDTSRTDPQAPDAGTYRTLMVQVYYPTDPCTPGAVEPYETPREALIFTADGGEGFSFPVGWQAQVLVHGREAISPSSDGAKFPVVLFSHGMTTQAPTYASFIEDLVSHGFVVAAISHTYDSDVLVFPDGTESDPNPSWEPPPFNTVMGPSTNPSAAEWNANWQANDAHIAVWTADARFVLDQITAWNTSDPQGLLTGRLDVDHIGYFGHSFGGATVAELCFADPRCKAGINLDGPFISPTRLDGGRSIPIPFMIQLNEVHGTELSTDAGWSLSTEGDGFQYDPSVKNTFQQLQDAGYEVRIGGTRHLTFWDIPLVLQKYNPGVHVVPSQFGTIDPARAVTIVNAYDLAFFEKHLKGMSEPLLEGPSPYAEVTFAKR
jgi:dienelactone hydrolase